ncbi:apolipoprotein N-acyltransferase [Brevundimonas diminuta]|uniref:apolipoprotein N-acyltransferase n=1 Tax=Brevundimonas diminuta TaxID=293 RepID=UPI0035D94141
MSGALAARFTGLLSNRWGRIALALLAGAGAALVHPPFGFLPGLLGYPLLLLLADRSGGMKGGFWVGWLAGFAYFFIGCWWVAEAFLVNPAQAWMAPFAASLLPAGMGLFWGLATMAYRRFSPAGVRRILLFAALFALLEWTRGHVLTGFPWNPAGAGWAAGSAMSQFASIGGVYGLGLITVAAVSALAPLADAGPQRPRLIAAGLGALTLIGLFVFGAVRLSSAQVVQTPTLVRLVQADIAQDYKWSPEAYHAILGRYLELTAQPAAALPDVVIWPEGALPTTANDLFATNDAYAVAAALQTGQTLLAGLSRGEPDPSAETGARYYNSLFALHDEGAIGLRIGPIYDKHRLVPFGEYLPMGALMSKIGVRSLVHVPADFTAGPTPAPISLVNAPPVQPLICYEALYPGFTPATAATRPAWIVNVSNDAWFGKTSGPRQHLNLASYRALETGLPVARATPTGVSAMIDPWGRIVEGKRLDPGQAGIIDVRLPQAAPPTLYGRWGDMGFAVLLIIMLIAGRGRAGIGRLAR